MERGLYSFINGTEERPAETATAQVKSAYQLRSDKAYSLIALSVEKTLQIHISTTTDPLETWEILRKQFEFVSITQIARLNRRFYAATMKEDGTYNGTYYAHDITGRAIARHERGDFRPEICNSSVKKPS